jgi:hypothetical protein
MSLFIRVDDYPTTKPEESYRHNLENFKRFHSILTRYVNGYVLGVIPGHVSMRDLGWMADQPEICIAQHGVVHDETSLDEFRGKRYQDVENLLWRGKNLLESNWGHHVVDYIPPHNVLNPDVVLALSRLGFRRIFGGPGTSEELISAIRYYGMEYWHSEPGFSYGRSDELLKDGSLDRLREHVLCPEVYQPDTWLTLHWTWECNIGFSNLETYLERLADVLCMFDNTSFSVSPR